MIEFEQAKKIAIEWIEVWNTPDPERIMSHYTNELEFISQLVVSRLGRKDFTIHECSDLRVLFEPSQGKDSTLRFELIDIMVGVSSVTLVNRNHRGPVAAETMFVDENRRADRVYVHRRPD